jgi:RHS repeat-associated protein
VPAAPVGATTRHPRKGAAQQHRLLQGDVCRSAARKNSGGALLAKIEGGATTYYHADQLSIRMATDANGNVIAEQGHYPFGEQWYAQNTTTKWQFTSYERDSESGNDYASFRYDINRLGRFASPDLLAGSVADPRSLNRYAYVLNDPVNFVDPLGLRDCPNPTPGGCAIVSNGAGGYTDRSIIDGLDLWDFFISDPVASMLQFTSAGTLALYPEDWGSPRYEGNETFLPIPLTLLTPSSHGGDSNPGVLIELAETTGGALMPQDPGGGAGPARPQKQRQTPQQKRQQCMSQYQRSVSEARSGLEGEFVIFFTAVGIPGDLALIGCIGTGELAPLCMEAVELALGGPSVAAAFAFVHEYGSEVDAAQAQLQACQRP